MFFGITAHINGTHSTSFDENYTRCVYMLCVSLNCKWYDEIEQQSQQQKQQKQRMLFVRRGILMMMRWNRESESSKRDIVIHPAPIFLVWWLTKAKREKRICIILPQFERIVPHLKTEIVATTPTTHGKIPWLASVWQLPNVVSVWIGWMGWSGKHGHS